MSNSFRQKFTAKFHQIGFRKCQTVSQSSSIKNIVIKNGRGRISLPRMHESAIKFVNVPFLYPVENNFKGVQKWHTYTERISFPGKFGGSQAEATSNSKMHEKWLFIRTYYFTIEHIAKTKTQQRQRYFLIGFTPHKAKQPLLSTELQIERKTRILKVKAVLKEPKYFFTLTLK